MTILREIIVDDPSIEIIENGEDAKRTLTAKVQVNQLMDRMTDEQIVWTIIWPNLTPHQFRCIGDQFILAAGHAEDDRRKLSRDQRFTVKLAEDSSG